MLPRGKHRFWSSVVDLAFFAVVLSFSVGYILEVLSSVSRTDSITMPGLALAAVAWAVARPLAEARGCRTFRSELRKFNGGICTKCGRQFHCVAYNPRSDNYARFTCGCPNPPIAVDMEVAAVLSLEMRWWSGERHPVKDTGSPTQSLPSMQCRADS
jgi:hypothetical protein